MMQHSLTPPVLEEHRPVEDGKDHDGRWRAGAQWYLVKSRDCLPINEALGSWLCSVFDLPHPAWQVVQKEDGELCFGSCWNDAAIKTSSPAAISYFSGGAQRDRALLMKAWVIDVFTYNIDRNPGNFLLLGGTVVPRPQMIDWSRAWWRARWWDCNVALPPTSTTSRVYGFLFQRGYTAEEWQKEVDFALEQVAQKARVDDLVRMLNSLPNQWVEKVPCNDLLAWWADGQPLKRLHSMRITPP